MKNASSHHSFCFAAPAYANSAPLAQFIPHVCPGASLILDHPAQLLNRLNDHRADAALMPVADLFANPDLMMIPGLGICANGLVRSVLLKCHRPLDRVTTVRWDTASRTSNALARLLMKHHWRRNVKFVTREECPDADAEVMIGDRALCEPPAQAGDYDLATAWKAFSGLPFVFAVWVHRKNHPHPEFLADVVNKAKEAGIQALPEIARQQSIKLGLSEVSCADYFTSCIRYDVGPEEREAMTLFRTIIRMEK
ncbi:MAG: menaquinone biosynthesis protein [bacterium]